MEELFQFILVLLMSQAAALGSFTEWKAPWVWMLFATLLFIQIRRNNYYYDEGHM